VVNREFDNVKMESRSLHLDISLWDWWKNVA